MVRNIKKEILSVSRDLFMKNGYNGTSTRDIAQIIGVSQPAIYHHFKNKEAIYVAMLEEFSDTVKRSLNAFIHESNDYERTLIRMIYYLKENHAMNLNLMLQELQTELSENAQFHVYQMWYSSYFTPFLSLFERLNHHLPLVHSPELTARHFLRVMSPYISMNPPSYDTNPIKLDDMVGIFFKGCIM